MRVRFRRPFLLVAVALALPAVFARPSPAAAGPRERAALVQLFATDAALARARESEGAAQARLTRVRADLRSLSSRLAVARSNERAAQRALALRLNEIYRARPLDAFAVLLESRSWSDVSAGLDLLDRLSRSDSSLVLSARRWHASLRVQSRTLGAAEARARSEDAKWQARVAALQQADRAHRALITRLRSEHVRAVATLASTAHRDVERARRVVRPAAAATPAHPRPRPRLSHLRPSHPRWPRARRCRSPRPPIRSRGTPPAACRSGPGSAPQTRV